MKNILIIFGFFITNGILAQKHAPENWYLLNPETNKVFGVGAEDAYKNLKNQKSKTVIVAIIDSGVETDHEDLKDVIWVNPGEIPNNGIDDDKNGYIDDVNGWSFIGGKNGDIENESTELARMYHKFSTKFSKLDTNNLSNTDSKEFNEFKKIRVDYITNTKLHEQELQNIDMLNDFVNKVKAQNNGLFTKEALKKYDPLNDRDKRIKKAIRMAFALGLKTEELDAQLKDGYKMISSMVKYNTIDVDSIRRVIVGDDPDNLNERYYGCNRVEGPDALHGTHVSGIVAAMRNNHIGIMGIADNVKIMPIRAVPNGDERDKDIANAIRYAVDNGAKVINMSFGKYYSPGKSIIDEAVEYAASKDVLLIHAAGNESKDADVESSFPCRELQSGLVAKNWIQVGASAFKKSKNIIGSFSNYGKLKVDLFAPGVDIYSTVCDNKYISESGTSMAAPAVTGVAAIIRSYFPELTAVQVRELLMKTVVPYDKSVKVPGTRKEKKRLKDLCISGGFVNVNNAVLELLKAKN